METEIIACCNRTILHNWAKTMASKAKAWRLMETAIIIKYLKKEKKRKSPSILKDIVLALIGRLLG